MSSGGGPRRGWLGDLAGGRLPDDGLYIGRSLFVYGGQQGRGNLWKVNDVRSAHIKQLSKVMGR